MKILALIPARFGSTRFPGKPLALINGKSMIQMVYENCREGGLESYVVTDDDRIENHVASFGGHSVRIDDNVQSGSDRIYLAFKRYFSSDKNIIRIINVQGDEPLLKGRDLKALASFHLKSDAEIATCVIKRKGFAHEDFHRPDIVKAVVGDGGRCLYFSRSPIPFMRGAPIEETWYQHVGVYSYIPSALEKFCASPRSFLEETEMLEQLRAMEMGMVINAIVTALPMVSVDVPEDVYKVEGVLSEFKAQ